MNPDGIVRWLLAYSRRPKPNPADIIQCYVEQLWKDPMVRDMPSGTTFGLEHGLARLITPEPYVTTEESLYEALSMQGAEDKRPFANAVDRLLSGLRVKHFDKLTETGE